MSDAWGGSQGGYGHGAPPGSPPAQPGQGGYGATPPLYAPPTPADSGPSGLAIAALVLGIVTWVFSLSVLSAIPGVIVARMELKSIERGESSPSGKTFAQIGFWLSLVNIILVGLAVGVGGCLVLGGVLTTFASR